MKTVTEYRPLNFGEIFVQSGFRRSRFPRIGFSGILSAAYCILGFFLFVDTGFAPWNWQFWMAFGPLFVAGELASRALSVPRSH